MTHLNHLFIADWEKVRGEQEVRTYFSLGFILLFTCTLHLLLGIYFWFWGIPGLSIYNLICLGFLLFLFQMSRLGHHSVSSVLGTTEVVLYTVICTAWFGWPASCQWYIIPAALPHFLFVDSTPRVKNFIATLSVVAMFSIFFYTWFYPPLYPQGESMMLRFINLCVITGSLVFEVKMNDLVRDASSRHYQQHIQSLQRDALIDPLTGLWNRRYIKAFFEQLSAVESPIFCVAIIDIDHFKQINDTYGHDTGDEVLRQMSQMLLERFRTTDVTVRWGGEEFLLMLRDVDLPTGTKIMDDFRRKISGHIIEANGHSLSITLTCGVTTFQPSATNKDDFQEAVRRSDACLYYGKAHGRDRVINHQMFDDAMVHGQNQPMPRDNPMF